MSVWIYSTRWPMWIEPLAYGSALVTSILRLAGGESGVEFGGIVPKTLAVTFSTLNYAVNPLRSARINTLL